MMKCFVWNVRGLDGESRHSTVIQWINHNRPLIDGLLETCVKQHKINFINVSAPSGMTFWFKSLRYGRKWKNNCGLGPKTDTVQTYVKTDQIMVCGVLFPVTNTSITMGFVYARFVFDWEKGTVGSHQKSLTIFFISIFPMDLLKGISIRFYPSLKPTPCLLLPSRLKAFWIYKIASILPEFLI